MKIHAAPKLEPGRVIVIADGIVVHDCWLWELMQVEYPTGKSVDFYLSPNDAQDFQAWAEEDEKRRRRMN